MKILPYLTPAGAPAAAAITEVLAVPLLVLALCVWVNPADPFFMQTRLVVQDEAHTF